MVDQDNMRQMVIWLDGRIYVVVIGLQDLVALSCVGWV